MKALTIFGAEDIRIVDVPKPKAGPDDIVIKVEKCGICGTDLMVYSGKGKLIEEGEIQYPVRIGHEFAGTIEEVGKDVKTLKVGDRVITDSGVTCGVCDACKRGDLRGCMNVKSVGTTHCWDGGFAEYVIFPQRHVFKLEDNLDFETASMIEPSTLAYRALAEANLKEGSNVYIIGTGAIGLIAVAIAKTVYKANVVMCGRTPAKLEIAKKLGAVATVNFRDPDPMGDLKKVFPNGADLVIEASGSLEALNHAGKAVARYGRLHVVGFYEKLLEGFDIDNFTTKAPVMMGITGDYGLPDKVNHIYAKYPELDLKPLITERISFKDAPEKFREMHAAKKGQIKVMVQINGETD